MQDTAEPISQDDSTSSKRCMRKGKIPHKERGREQKVFEIAKAPPRSEKKGEELLQVPQ